MGSHTVESQIPTIDISMEPGSSAWLTACNSIRLAMEEYGCFVALTINFHQNPYEVFDALKELFDLPQETKMKNGNPKPAHG
ncbi:hypothetical protein SLE2022_311360 [Rubroshorea leprosula]